MPMRITGLGSTLDIDSIVTDSLKGYKTKIDVQKQQKQILEWKQSQYQAIMKKANSFYEKYLTTTGSSSLYKLSSYKQAKFTSSNEAVSVSSSSRSTIQNYTVSDVTVATKSSATIDKGYVEDGNVVVIGGEEFTLKGSNHSEIAENLQDDIAKYNSSQSDASKKIDVKVRYSDMANNGSGGLIIENSKAGNKQLNVSMGQILDSDPGAQTVLSVGTTGKYSTTISKSSLKAGSTLQIGTNAPITLSGSNETEIANNLIAELSSQGIDASYDSTKGVMTLKAINSGDSESNKFTAKLKDGDNETELKVDIDGKYTTSIPTSSIDENSGIKIGNRIYRISLKDSGEIDTEELNKQLEKSGQSITARVDGGNLILESKNTGVAAKFSATVEKYNTTNTSIPSTSGKDLSATIRQGNDTIYIAHGKVYTTKNPDGSYSGEVNNPDIKINENNVSIDGTTFKFNNDYSGDIEVTGSQDVSKLKDTIVSFIKDYNDLLGEINGKLWETYDSDYQPLTDEQKEAMSDKQIDNWETKAKTGLLRRDDDLRTLSEKMKNIMSTFMSSTGLSLEKIGFKPVNDYKENNGKFEIDEEKLTQALQNHFDEITDLFIKGNESQEGIITQMHDLMYDNFAKFDSVFNKKAASSGVYALTNEMTKAIEEKKNLITKLNKDYTTRQNNLYSKYSSLETAMAKAQSQQASMSAWFGGSN